MLTEFHLYYICGEFESLREMNARVVIKMIRNEMYLYEK